MDLFDLAREQQAAQQAPLAARMRPRTLEEFFGQEAVVGPGTLLRRAIEADRLSSVIFYGPPGTGKTTLARIIANLTKAHFASLNAVTAGIADLRKVTDEARERQGMYGVRTVLFVDEIHRWSKAQQDALLPYVEDGTIILIGATTENPLYEVNPALVSRSRLFRLEPLSEEHLRTIVQRALTDRERGLGNLNVRIDADALQHLVQAANGDARAALSALELAALSTEPEPKGPNGAGGVRRITLDAVAQSMQKKALPYDRAGDNHYDTISAFIKSMRGSDPDAALYWLARMIHAGEDPLFIARRIVICAAEDVGMADPQALVVSSAAMQAVHMIGLPEARIILAEAAVYVATAPKSNASYTGINRALDDVQNRRAGGVPLHLRDASHSAARRLGYGEGYKYAHDYPGNYVPQEYLPDEIKGTTYYRPTANGYEQAVGERLQRLRAFKNDAK